MRRLRRILGYTLVVLVVLLVVTINFTIGWRPFLGPRTRPLADRKFGATPERLARGRYLAENVAGCMDCHSPHDWTQHDAPIPPGKEGSGQHMQLGGVPGTLYAPNLTPDPETGSGNWTDDQIARAIREGIGHDGRALFPLMPYQHFKSMSDEDLASVVVFLRSLPAVRNPLPQTQIIFPVKYLIRSAPEPVTQPVPQPDLSTPLARGAYLVNMAACSDCHTPQKQGQPIRGMDFAGGFILEGPWGRVASANITQDPTGIPYYDDQLFLEVLRTGYVKARKLSQIMPWHEFRGMTDEDLFSTFAYLKTIPPIHHRVDNTEPPTLCPLDGAMHGAGSSNTK
ncbi:MAG TPA: c-type cytochrome [Methylomirabilota bacterium]|nr:c-type cytochrome [Methylomirabilota bacterium]